MQQHQQHQNAQGKAPTEEDDLRRYIRTKVQWHCQNCFLANLYGLANGDNPGDRGLNLIEEQSCRDCSTRRDKGAGGGPNNDITRPALGNVRGSSMLTEDAAWWCVSCLANLNKPAKLNGLNEPYCPECDDEYSPSRGGRGAFVDVTREEEAAVILRDRRYWVINLHLPQQVRDEVALEQRLRTGTSMYWEPAA